MNYKQGRMLVTFEALTFDEKQFFWEGGKYD